MDREGGNKEKMRKCREWTSLHFLILSPFPLHFLILSPFLRSPAARLPQFEDRVDDIEWNTNVDNSWKAMKLFCDWNNNIFKLYNQINYHDSNPLLSCTQHLPKHSGNSWTDQRGEIRPHFILLWTFCARLTSICGQFFVCTAVLRYCSTGHLESMGVLKIPYI